MGQSLCCLRPAAASTTHNVGKKSSKINNIARDDEKRKLKVESSMMTLEQCLKNSPAINTNCSINHRSQPRKRVFPSTSSPDFGDTTPFYTPRLSFSMSGKIEKIDEEGHVQPCSRSSASVVVRREKGKKKVTFRLPEADDIIVYYSPKQNV